EDFGSASPARSRCEPSPDPTQMLFRSAEGQLITRMSVRPLRARRAPCVAAAGQDVPENEGYCDQPKRGGCQRTGFPVRQLVVRPGLDCSCGCQAQAELEAALAASHACPV